MLQRTITIITASYNSAATIRETLESINIQAYPAIEHIVVDGGSTDDTLKIVAAHGRRVARVTSEKDDGIYDAFNKGLALASGEVIGFLNSDDVYSHASVIEQVMAPFEDEALDAVYADLVYVERADISHITRHWKSRPYRDGDFARAFVPPHPTLFLRRRVYERTGGFDTGFRLASDYEYMLRAFHKHGVKSVHLPQIIVKMRAGGATGGTLPFIRRQNAEILRALDRHAVQVSKPAFFLRKSVDRLLQRARAPFVRLPL
jgi:glycosyltransferase involved in cell wall biosynthesis